MILIWNIRYLDRSDKQFKDRHLFLDTKTLDAVTRAAVELVAESKSRKSEREILRHKHLFIERSVDDSSVFNNCGSIISVGPSEYFEDETGKELSDDEMARILTGNPTARFIPRGAKQHDIDYMLAESKPIPLEESSLNSEEIRLLGYFVRDLREMQKSAFMKDGPGSLHSSGSPMLSPTGNPTLETAVTDEEIRSFVTIFRRLYMTGDPASFTKIIPIAVAALKNHPYGKWIEGAAKEYLGHLNSTPDARPLIASNTCTFTTKRLIDVFLYTQYAHQPSIDRQRQFEECLAQLQGKIAILTWMFLTEMWYLSNEIANVGNVISYWFKHYCDHHGVSPDILNSLLDHHAGLGAAEKEKDRQSRLFREKVEQLATDLWMEAGQPDGGLTQFLSAARNQLARKIKD